MTTGRKSVQGPKQGKQGSKSHKKGASQEVLNVLPAEVKREEQLSLPDTLPEIVVDLEPKKSKSVDDLSGDELKSYAAKVGISQRDIDGLSEDRLRQNCKVRIFNSINEE
jgi:hypothetical protein